MMMHRYTPAFLISSLLMAVLIVVAVFGGYLKPHGLTEQTRINLDTRIVGGEQVQVSPPLKPDHRFWLGTVHRGWDMISILMSGMKYTFGLTLLIAISRFAIGLPIGLYTGTTGRGRKVVDMLQWIFTAVPAFVFVYPALSGIHAALGLQSGLPISHPNNLVFGKIMYAVVTLIGVAGIAKQFQERSRFYSDKLYIDASRLLGASTWRIMFRHMLPCLRVEIMFAFLAEFVQILFLLGQLAIFGIYVGGGLNLDYEDYKVRVPQTGEWCAMIEYAARTMRIYPWIMLAVGLFYTASILIMQFFLHQLKVRFHPAE